MEDAIDRGGATLLLAARLVPIVPFSLTGIVAGAARVPLWRFTWTTAVGYLPITAYLRLPRQPARGASRSRTRSSGSAAVGLLIAMMLAVRYLRPSSRELDELGRQAGSPRALGAELVQVARAPSGGSAG